MFFLVPILIMFVYSLMPRGIYGGVEPGFTLEHYRRFFDPLYLDILRRTFVWSIACTVICLLLGYPVAYAIARAGAGRTSCSSSWCCRSGPASWSAPSR